MVDMPSPFGPLRSRQFRLAELLLPAANMASPDPMDPLTAIPASTPITAIHRTNPSFTPLPSLSETPTQSIDAVLHSPPATPSRPNTGSSNPTSFTVNHAHPRFRLHTYSLSSSVPDFTAISYSRFEGTDLYEDSAVSLASQSVAHASMYPEQTPLLSPIVFLNDVPVTLPLGLYLSLVQFQQDILSQGPQPESQPVGAKSWPSTYVWADALCLNLSDPAAHAPNTSKGKSTNRIDPLPSERNYAPPQTGLLFPRAACVYAWLGPQTPASILAIDKIHEVLDRFELLTQSNIRNPHASDPNNSLPENWAGLVAEDFFACEEDDDDEEAIQAAVQEFFDNDWWSQIHSLPEATTNRPTWLVLGPDRIDLASVLQVAMLIGLASRDTEHGEQAEEQTESGQTKGETDNANHTHDTDQGTHSDDNNTDRQEGHALMYNISSYVYGIKEMMGRRQSPFPRDRDLLTLLMACRHYDAIDPRDKVFAVLSMTEWSDSTTVNRKHDKPHDKALDRKTLEHKSSDISQFRQPVPWQPDYSLPFDLVFARVCSHFLRTVPYGHLLDFLGSDGLPEGSLTGLPSWLPDWRFRKQYHVPLPRFFEVSDDSPSNDHHHPSVTSPSFHTPAQIHTSSKEGPSSWSSSNRTTSAFGQPDVTTPTSMVMSEEDPSSVWSPVYHASGTWEDIQALDSRLTGPQDLAAIDASGRLHVQGFRVGFLHDLQPCLEPGDPMSALATWKDAISDAYYFTGETQESALHRLLVADVDFDHSAARQRLPTVSRRAVEPRQTDSHEKNRFSLSVLYEHPETDETHELDHDDNNDTELSTDGVLMTCTHRRLARVAQKGWRSPGLALVPDRARPHDEVFALLGGQMLYVLRPLPVEASQGERTAAFRFVGECYVHGLMDGQVLDMLRQGAAEMQAITLV